MRILAISLNWNWSPRIETHRAETASVLPNTSDATRRARFTK